MAENEPLWKTSQKEATATERISGNQAGDF